MFFAINTALIEPRLAEIEASIAAIRAAMITATIALCIQREAANMVIATAAIADWADANVLVPKSPLNILGAGPRPHGAEVISRGNMLCAQFELLFPTRKAMT